MDPQVLTTSGELDKMITRKNGYSIIPKRRRIGYWMSAKKLKKMDMSKFAVVCRSAGYDLVQVDFSRPLEQQGPFDVFLHKLTDMIVKAEQNEAGDQEAVELFRVLEHHMNLHPETIVIDPIENVKKLLLRQRQYYLTMTSSACQHANVFTPAFVEVYSTLPGVILEDLRRASVKFPIVCKAREAHGSSDAHRMMIIFNADGLRSIKVPCVAQSFVNHDAILYKVFVMGDKFHVVRRPSFENFSSTDLPPVVFDSQNIDKAEWLCEDAARPSQTRIAATSVPVAAGIELDPEVVSHIVKGIRKQFGLALIGIDLIVDTSSKKLAIIDVNAFPSYDGVPDFFQSLFAHIHYTVEQRDSKLSMSFLNGHSIPTRVKTNGVKLVSGMANRVAGN